MNPAASWLEEHAAAAPPSLRTRMAQAVEQAARADTTRAADRRGDTGVAGVLAEAALLCLQDALERCDERRAALPLLAADALVTAACEAAAEQGPDAVLQLAASLEPRALEHLAARV